jgi:N-acetyl-beta-hexosaminidase
MEVTKEDFEQYEDMRHSGRFNVFDPNARRMTGLSKEIYFEIIRNYSQYMAKWPDVRKK